MGAQQLFEVGDQRGRLCHTQAVIESHDLGRAVADQAQVHLRHAGMSREDLLERC